MMILLERGRLCATWNRQYGGARFSYCRANTILGRPKRMWGIGPLCIWWGWDDFVAGDYFDAVWSR